jgi:hypothetical protein
MKTTRRFLLSSFLLITTLAGLAPTHASPSATSAITVDGKLTEPGWLKAHEETGFQPLSKRTSKTVMPPTRFRWFADGEAVCVAVICDEPEMSKLGPEGPEATGLAAIHGDSVELFLDPTGRGAEYYQFVLNVSGATFQGYFIESGNTTIGEYGGIWQAAVNREKDRWTAEIRVPLSAFYHTPSAKFAPDWKVNVTRNRHEGGLATWSPLEGSFHEPQRFKKLGAFPAKDSRHDLLVEAIELNVKSREAAGYTATGVLDVRSERAVKEPVEIELRVGEKTVGRQTAPLATGTTTVKLDKIALAGTGKTKAEVIIKDAGGHELHRRTITRVAKYEPIAIEFRVPFYANCIFPGQEPEEAVAEVTLGLPEVSWKGATLQVSQIGGTSAEPWTRSFPVPGERTEVRIPGNILKEGTNDFSIELKQGEKVIEKTHTRLRKLPKPETAAVVYIDPNLNLVANEKPLFVLGWYGGTYGLSQRLKKEFGSNPSSQFVNTWNCWVNVEPERLSKVDLQRLKQDVAPSAEIYERLEEKIANTLKNPKAWFYYLSDEPECRGVSPIYLKYLYDYIKERDPYHPVLVITRAPEQFTGCADILSPHPYLNPRVSPSGERTMKSPTSIRDQIRTVYRAGKGRIPAWCTPQAFSYGFLEEGATMPTFDEFRCMVYAAVVNGAKGLIPFMYSCAFESLDIRYGHEFIYEELAALEAFLLQPLPANGVKVSAEENGVDAMLQEKDGEAVLLTVNLLNRPVKAEITLPDRVSTKEWDGFRTDETAVVRAGKLEISYEPYEVKTFTSAKRDENLKSLAVFRKELAEKWSAVKTPGNVLAGHERDVIWDANSRGILGAGSRVLYSLSDTIKDALGLWIQRSQATEEVTMGFQKFIPKFRTVRLHGAGIANAEIWVLKLGEWQRVGSAEWPADQFQVDVPLEKEVTTVKAKLVLKSRQPGAPVELYEVELLAESSGPPPT